MHRTHARRALSLTAGALLLATVAGAAPAVAAPPASDAPPSAGARHIRTLDIVSTDTSLTAPATATPGPATFRSSTTHEGSGWVGLARQNPDGSTAFLGGVVIHPGKPGRFTQTLVPGEYVLFDYLYSQGSQPRQRTLTVAGAVSGRTPVPTATITSKEVPGAGPRFTVDGTLRAGKPLRFTNQLPDRHNEAVLFPLDKGVDRAELQAFFDAVNEGASPTPPFDTSTGLGSLPLSTGASQVIQVPLQRGRHVLVTWVRDAKGELLAKQGQFEIVEVR